MPCPEGLAWFLRGVHRRKCKNHAKRVLRNECKGMRGNVVAWTLRDASPAERGSGKAIGFEARGETSPLFIKIMVGYLWHCLFQCVMYKISS